MTNTHSLKQEPYSTIRQIVRRDELAYLEKFKQDVKNRLKE